MGMSGSASTLRAAPLRRNSTFIERLICHRCANAAETPSLLLNRQGRRRIRSGPARQNADTAVVRERGGPDRKCKAEAAQPLALRHVLVPRSERPSDTLAYGLEEVSSAR